MNTNARYEVQSLSAEYRHSLDFYFSKFKDLGLNTEIWTSIIKECEGLRDFNNKQWVRNYRETFLSLSPPPNFPQPLRPPWGHHSQCLCKPSTQFISNTFSGPKPDPFSPGVRITGCRANTLDEKWSEDCYEHVSAWVPVQLRLEYMFQCV